VTATLELDLTLSIGLELIGKQALGILKEGLNDELASRQADWETLDGLMGYKPITVERVAPDNFYYGHRPSLIDAPLEKYPNCAAMAYSAQPAAEGDLHDHEDVYDVSLFVELMCKSDDEGVVNSRIARTADAAHAVLIADPTLKGLVVAIGNQPIVVLTDVFARPERDGARFVWQGARLEYKIKKYSVR
jgi:hypothetical protein